jgi:hypothetical protein
MPPSVKFQPKCNPIGSHSVRPSEYPARRGGVAPQSGQASGTPRSSRPRGGERSPVWQRPGPSPAHGEPGALREPGMRGRQRRAPQTATRAAPASRLMRRTVWSVLRYRIRSYFYRSGACSTAMLTVAILRDVLGIFAPSCGFRRPSYCTTGECDSCWCPERASGTFPPRKRESDPSRPTS